MLGALVMKHSTTCIRALLFDWAGTMVDHGSRAPIEALIQAFRRSGIELTPAEARGPMGRAKRDHVAAILALPRVTEAWRRLKGGAPTDQDVARLYADFLPLQAEVLARHSDVISGVPEVMSECRRRGLKLGSTTGYTRDLMDVAAPLARAAGFDPNVIICADDVQQGRPAPWMIFRAAERLDVFPMTAVIVVDDTAVGIEAGLNAGAWTVAVSRTGNRLGLSEREVAQLDKADLAARLTDIAADFQRQGAHFVIESVAEILPILDQLERRLSRKHGSRAGVSRATFQSST
jgi:phosphonoacetaldehyde hydrolase